MGSCSTYCSVEDLRALTKGAESSTSKISESFEEQYSVRVEVYDTEVTATSSTDSSPIIKISGLHTTGGIVRLCSSTHFLAGNLLPALQQPLQQGILHTSSNKSLPNLHHSTGWQNVIPDRISSPEIQCKEHNSSHTVVPHVADGTQATSLRYMEDDLTICGPEVKTDTMVPSDHRQGSSFRTFVINSTIPHVPVRTTRAEDKKDVMKGTHSGNFNKKILHCLFQQPAPEYKPQCLTREMLSTAL